MNKDNITRKYIKIKKYIKDISLTKVFMWLIIINIGLVFLGSYLHYNLLVPVYMSVLSIVGAVFMYSEYKTFNPVGKRLTKMFFGLIIMVSAFIANIIYEIVPIWILSAIILVILILKFRVKK